MYSSSEQWVTLTIFFALFTLSGLYNRPRARQFEYFHFLVFGVMTVLANLLLLYFINKTNMGAHDLLSALLLKQTSIEGSFIIFGYCLMFRGLGQFIRLQFGSRSAYSRDF